MACLQVAEEEWPPIWRVASNILNKQLQTAYKGWSFSLSVVGGTNNPVCKKLLCYETFTIASGLDLSFGTTHAMEKEELPEQGKELIKYLLIRKVIKQIAVIIEAYH